eukprot:5534575-Alexandrium_andersonii.AAC.1
MAKDRADCGLEDCGLELATSRDVLWLRAPSVPAFVGRSGVFREKAQNAPVGSFEDHFEAIAWPVQFQ